MIFEILKIVLMISGIFCTLIGLLTVVMWARPAKEPADPSNRINNISSWWVGLTKPHIMAKTYKYFRQDVVDNVLDVEKTVSK